MSEEQSILINIVKDCVFVVRLTGDNQPGRFVRVNDAACSLLGYSAEEFAEMTPGDIEAPEAAGLSAEQAARELWKNKHAVFETVLVAKSGIKILVEINARICRLHGAAHIVASAIDRTGRREADEYLRENETRLSLAMDATSTGMWDWHVQTGEVVFNEKWAEIAGYTLKELQPVTIQTWMNLCHPEDLESSNRKLEKYFAGETDCYDCEARIKHKNGSWRWIRDRGKVVEWDDQGRPLRMIGTHTDIHLQKKYEQELKKHVRELNERNKELNCLFAISRMVEDPGHCLDDIIQNTINILAASMQYPEYACGRIRIKDHDYLTENFTETSWKLSRDILVNGYPEGCIEIFYMEPGPETREGPFLREEKNLLDAVAERLGHIIGRIQTEEKLRRSEQKFKDIFNSTGDAIFIHDMEGNFLEVNEVACRRLGYSREELLRMTPMDLDTQEYRELAPERIQTIVQDGINVFESAHRRKDGTVIPVEINSRKIEYEGKLRILSTARDITERRKRQVEYEKILNTSIDGFWVIDTKGIIEEINPAGAQLLGYTPEEMLNLRVADLEVNENPEEFERHIETIKKIGHEKFETRHMHKNGHPVYVEVSTSHIPHFREKFVAFIRDITDRKKLERESRINQMRLEAVQSLYNMSEHTEKDICDTALAKMVMLSESEIGFLGFITESESVMEIHAWSANAMEKCAIYDKPFVFPLEMAGLWGEPVRNRKTMIFNDYTSANEGKNGLPGGHVDISRFMAAPVFDNNQIAAVAAVGNKKEPYDNIDSQQLELFMRSWWEIIKNRRIYEEKEMLEARLQEAQRIESIGRLAGGVAHDLNNMLAPVLGYAELLIVQANPVDPDIIEPLNEILTAGKRARDLVGQLLAFGRKQMLEFEPINLNLVVQRLNNLIRKTIREDIRINIHPARSLPDIKGDSSQLERVIMNLVLNAQDAMPRGGVLTIETAMVLVEPDQDLPEEYSPMPPGSYVMLELSDTGHGMDRETMKQVFEPFFTTKEMDKGSGLGLATSYGIIKQHGGEIRVSSKEGTGTTFKIYLPAYYGNSEQARDETKLSADTGAAAKGSETILLVEDEKNVRDLAVKALQQLGYRVVEASNGHEAISLLASRREPVDLLVTDVIMPGLNGGQLYEEISSLRPELKVLYMSGYTDDVLFSYGLTETDTHFIRKPFSIKEFASSVRKALGQ